MNKIIEYSMHITDMGDHRVIPIHITVGPQLSEL